MFNQIQFGRCQQFEEDLNVRLTIPLNGGPLFILFEFLMNSESEGGFEVGGRTGTDFNQQLIFHHDTNFRQAVSFTL